MDQRTINEIRLSIHQGFYGETSKSEWLELCDLASRALAAATISEGAPEQWILREAIQRTGQTVDRCTRVGVNSGEDIGVFLGDARLLLAAADQHEQDAAELAALVEVEQEARDTLNNEPCSCYDLAPSKKDGAGPCARCKVSYDDLREKLAALGALRARAKAGGAG